MWWVESEGHQNPAMSSLTPCEHQVGGWHKGAQSLVLKDGKGHILKPLKLNANPTFDPHMDLSNRKGHPKDELLPVCRDELEFYQRLATSTRPDDQALRPLMPSFHGSQNVSGDDGKESPHLVLEDLTWGLRLPCVVDIKLGRTFFYPGKDHYKNTSKYATQQELGFCLTGMRVMDAETGSLMAELHPSDCKQLTAPQLLQALKTFCQDKINSGSHLHHTIVSQLHHIQRWFQTQSSYKIRGSSILVVYDAGQLVPKPPGMVNGEAPVSKDSSPTAVVKMIDFAHVLHSFGDKDENYMFGLENLIQYFSKKENDD